MSIQVKVTIVVDVVSSANLATSEFTTTTTSSSSSSSCSSTSYVTIRTTTITRIAALT
jgi:hypothetical protein